MIFIGLFLYLAFWFAVVVFISWFTPSKKGRGH
jgi:hypothetical protein